ncbi:6449_t:CDS:2 [Cetraspora pellucida]|uniref:6449_t:CDS:1 n=1 Tax=Cetraspora pellucida TaxID=1433469 RepID=A0A9N8ZAG8_9GLOM|nr:6449_t:CDS:2 [Cetraspora pellucida]
MSSEYLEWHLINAYVCDLLKTKPILLENDLFGIACKSLQSLSKNNSNLPKYVSEYASKLLVKWKGPEREHWFEIAKKAVQRMRDDEKIEANKAEIRQKKVIQHQRIATTAIELVTTELDELPRKHVLDADGDEKKNTEGATILAKKCKTESENKTKSGRTVVPNYSHFYGESITDDDASENSSSSSLYELNDEVVTQKNDHFDKNQDIQIDNQNSSTLTASSTIETDESNQKSLKDLLGGNLYCSENMKSICQHHDTLYPDENLIDLRPNSNYFNKLPFKILEPYFKELDDKIENLIPLNIHEFLIEFFQQDLTSEEWHIKIDDLCCLDQSDWLMASLWYISAICYEFGEIGSKNHVKRECADGVGHLNTADKFQLVYMEGTRINAKNDKEITDASKISNNLQSIFINIIKDNIKCRRRFPKTLAVFGGQSFRLRIHLQFLNYCEGKFCLNEVDNANLPRDFTEMVDFVFFYECVIKWALLAREVKEGFEKSRSQQRPSRFSYINSLNVANTL